jgi:hypothetical protein
MSLYDTTRLLSQLQSLTQERERPLLEAALASALRDLLGAARVSILKLSQTPQESFVWPAVVVDAEGTRIRDDGVSVPADMISVGRLPRLQACLDRGSHLADAGKDLFPLLKANGACFGFVDIEGCAIDEAQIEIAERLQAIFCASFPAFPATTTPGLNRCAFRAGASQTRRVSTTGWR